jgi:hypothetical protein
MPAPPVEVTDEDAAHVAQLGLRHELDQILEWVGQKVCDLQRIRVDVSTLWGKEMPLVTVWAYQDAATIPPVPEFEWAWAEWRFKMFPLDIGAKFTVILVPVAAKPAA